jgi:hypothetical protein
MSKLRFNITMSLDGFVAGPKQSEQDPLSVGGMELHRWMLPLAAFREQGEEGGEVNASTPVVKGLFERRRDRDGPQHVRRRSRPVGGEPVERLVGRRPARARTDPGDRGAGRYAPQVPSPTEVKAECD